MRTNTIAGIFAGGLIAGSGALLAAPGQTMQPGQMTQAKVWVQNSGRGEAIPVDLRDVNVDRPLRMQIVNGDPAQGTPNPLAVRVLRPLWDYKLITVAPGSDMSGPLNGEGAGGWETTGIAYVTATGTALVLKRPR